MTKIKKSAITSAIYGNLFIILPVLFILGGCAPYAPAARSGQEIAPVPADYSITNGILEPQKRWWETFGDDELNEFVEEALASNQTLAAFWARLGKAEALAARAGADLFPAVGGEAEGLYSRSSRTENADEQDTENKNYSLGLAASYELDLWGRIRSEKQSTRLAALASRQDLNSAAITVAAEVAERWVRIIAQRRQKILLEKQLAANKTYLDLVDLRFRKSLASALDVMQQRQLVERVKAQMPLIEMEEQLLLDELAVLLGRQPHDRPILTRDTLPGLNVPPVSGIPVQLLEYRPDILAAFHRVSEVDHDLAEARANRLPALRLTGSAAYSSEELEELFDNWLANLAAGLTAPLIDGGRRRDDIRFAEAAVREQLAAYRQTVLNAVREVESSLVRETKIRQNITGLENQLEAARTALEEAGFRYTNGLIDYLPVLTQLISVQNLERDLIFRRADLLIARLNLYRSIGGTWTESLSPPDPENSSKNGL